jgi:hypothetical protein
MMENTVNTWKRGLLFAVAGTMLGMAIPAQAANINARKMGNGVYSIVISGNIIQTDGATLAKVIEKDHITNASVP